MKKSLMKLLILLLISTSFLNAKILVVVDKNYYNDLSEDINGKGKVDRFISDVKHIEKENVDLLIYENISGTHLSKITDLWKKLCEEYNNSKLNLDNITGTILIGNLPIPVLKESDHGSFWYVPFDYLYMNLYDDIADTSYKSTSDIQLIYSFENSTNSFTKNKPNNMNELDVWVSRIYADNLEGLRSQDSEWGNFLEPHEIISRYFDKVHERMTLPSKVPARAMAMGHIGEWYNESEALERLRNNVLCFDRLPFSDKHYIVGSTDPNEVKINCPQNWQSQLQSGPYGNINEGAFNGTKTGNISDQRYLSTFANSDTLGFEWVGIYEHGNSSQTGFNGSHNGDGLNGNFFSYNNGPIPQIIQSGGYNNSPYYLSKLDDKNDFSYSNPMGGLGWEANVDKLGRWRFRDIPSGNYEIYIYLSQDQLPDGYTYTDKVYVNAYSYNSLANCLDGTSGTGFFNQFVEDFDNKSKISIDGWVKVCDYSPTSNPSFVNISFHPFHKQLNNGKKAFTLNTIKLVEKNAATSDIVLDISDPETFYTDYNLKNRTFYDMQDDGGQSKAHFFLFNSCHFNHFLQPNNLGLNYAMGHAGLISFGTSTNNTAGNGYHNFINNIIDNLSFGESIISFCNNKWETFSLLGAGTLKPKAYIPFVEDTSSSVYLEPFTGKARDIDAGLDGSVYMVTENYKFLCKWSDSKWDTISAAPNNENITSVATAIDGTPWIVTASNKIYKRVNNSWSAVSSDGFSLDINDNNDIVLISSDRKSIVFSNGSLWSEVPFLNSGRETLNRIALGNNNTAWVTTSNQKIFRYLNEYWEEIKLDEPVVLNDISIDKDGILTVSTDDRRLFKLTGSGWLKKNLLAGAANYITHDNDGLYWLSYHSLTWQIMKEYKYDNMLADGDFNNNGHYAWDIWNDGSAIASKINGSNLSYAYDEAFNVLNTAYGIRVDDGGDYQWSAILAHRLDLNIINGRKYRVSFWARQDNPTSTNNDVLATVSLNEDPWTEYGAHEVNLTNEYRRYEFEFTMADPSDDKAILQFCIGNHSRSVYFDNVQLEDITNEISRGGSSDYAEWNISTTYVYGDYVSYNGSNYMAKWWTLGETPGSSDVWLKI